MRWNRLRTTSAAFSITSRHKPSLISKMTADSCHSPRDERPTRPVAANSCLASAMSGLLGQSQRRQKNTGQPRRARASAGPKIALSTVATGRVRYLDPDSRSPAAARPACTNLGCRGARGVDPASAHARNTPVRGTVRMVSHTRSHMCGSQPLEPGVAAEPHRGHVFISYVKEDSQTVDRLQRDLHRSIGAGDSLRDFTYTRLSDQE